MESPIFLWVVLIAGSFICGLLCVLSLKKNRFLLVSAFIPWLIFLAFNLFSEFHSPDRELMQGGWPFFQLTSGSISAISGFLGGLLVHQLRKQRSNTSFKRDALKRAP
jgi:hypothetical protein